MTLGPLMLDLAGPELTAEERRLLCTPVVGGVILFSRNIVDREQVRALCAEIHALRTPRLLIAVDQEGGRVQRLRDGYLQLPPLHWIGRQHDLDQEQGRRLATLCGWLMAAEVLDSGIDLSFAPVVDVDHGLSEVIGDRALHSTPETVAELALAFMRGMRRAGMAAVAKHFPGHGGVTADSHHELPVDQRSASEIGNDMLPYEQLIPHGLNGIMAAHVVYARIDPVVASVSRFWLQQQLRERLHFQGAIFSDDLSMAALAAVGDPLQRARLALAAGADMVLLCNAPEAQQEVVAGLAGYENPVGQARLVALRPRAGRIGYPEGKLHPHPEWQAAVASLHQALAAPELKLHG